MRFRDQLRSVAFAVLFIGLASVSAAGNIADRATRAQLAGVDVVTYPMDVADVVTIVGTLPAGDIFAERDGVNLATATLTGMLLDKGTLKQDKFAIARQLDGVGAHLGFQVDSQTLRISGRVLKKDLPLLIRTLAEELRTPAFSEEEFQKARTHLIGGIRQQMEDTGYRSQEAFSRAVFPTGHPNRLASLGEMAEAAEKATVEEIRAFHKKYYAATHLRLVFVGDVNTKQIQTEVSRAFAGWAGGVDVIRSVSGEAVRSPLEKRVPLAEKTSVSVLLGESTGLRYQDKDSLALRVGTAVLGSGFTGRLMASVRDKEGLTYGIGANAGEDTYVDGTWTVFATFAPSLLDRGLASTRREVEQWWREGVTSDELAARKLNMIGQYQVGLATTAGMAGAILTMLERGMPLSWLDDLPKAINALTVDQVNAAIRKYVDPQKLVLVEAGTFETPPAR